MERKYWIKNNRVIFPLPAPIKEQLEDKGVEFENNGTADYRVIGKEVRIKFVPKESEDGNTDKT